MAHRYIVGQSGAGKSTLIKSLILKDIRAGYGVFFLDPHGDDTLDLLPHIPKDRTADTVLFDPSRFTIPWNPLTIPNRPAFIATSLAETVKDAWGYDDFTTPNIDLCVYNGIAALIETGQPFIGFYLLLTSADYRNFIIPKLKDRVVRDYWDTLNKMNTKDRRAEVKSTLNKIHLIAADPILRAMLGPAPSRLNLADILTGKILLARLPQNVLGIQKVALLGSLLLSQLHHTALSRDTTVPFYVYVDEFHHFAKGTLKEMYSGIRKWNVHMTVAHQYLEQVDRSLLAAVRGNAAQHYIFRVSPEDAKRIEITRRQHDLYEIPNYQARVWTPAATYDEFIEPLTGKPVPGSENAILSNMGRNYHQPKAPEIVDSFLAGF